MLADAARDLADQDVAFLGIDSRDLNESQAQAFVRTFDIPYPEPLRPGGSTLLAFRGTLTAEVHPQHGHRRPAGPGRGQRARRDRRHHALRPRRGGRPRRWPDWFESTVLSGSLLLALPVAAWRGWCRSSRRAWCRCCPATSPTPPACPAPTSATPGAAGWCSAAAVRARLLVRLRRARHAVGALGGVLWEHMHDHHGARRAHDPGRAGLPRAWSRGCSATSASTGPGRRALPRRRCSACSSGSAGRPASARPGRGADARLTEGKAGRCAAQRRLLARPRPPVHPRGARLPPDARRGRLVRRATRSGSPASAG